MYSGSTGILGGLANGLVPISSTQSKAATLDASEDLEPASNLAANGSSGVSMRERRLSKHREELQQEFKIDKEFSLLRHLGTGAYGVVA